MFIMCNTIKLLIDTIHALLISLNEKTILFSILFIDDEREHKMWP